MTTSREKFGKNNPNVFKKVWRPFPALKELLASLDLPKGVATNGPMEKVELTLSLTGSRAFFAQHVYSAYDMGYFKPSPKLFLHVAKALGVPARDCAVVEDSLTGVTAGLCKRKCKCLSGQTQTLTPTPSCQSHLHSGLARIEKSLVPKPYFTPEVNPQNPAIDL
jgi:beta-phosphoglucomutase-like phosphatase (HAD superfamily)